MVASVPAITLKEIPRPLHRELKARAKLHHRSLNKEVIATLQEATAATRPLDATALITDARKVRRKFSREITAAEIQSWKKSGRL